MRLGDLEGARALFEESLTRYRALGGKPGPRRGALQPGAELARRRGDAVAAEEHLRESL